LAGSDPHPDLVVAARDARRHAFAPYSRFKVGAAIEVSGGAVITGCNVESATYGLTLCAERVALVRAVAEGHRRFRRIAIVAATRRRTPPCGACRQLLWELGGDLEVASTIGRAILKRRLCVRSSRLRAGTGRACRIVRP
jgi:cytidine deaminase